jgi:hypothetical protein
MDAVVDSAALKVALRDDAGTVIQAQYTLVGSAVKAVSVWPLPEGLWLVSYTDTSDALHRRRSTECEPNSSAWETLF